MGSMVPIILSGGAGSRLWPVSRRLQPKPFMQVAGKPLLAHALARAALVAEEAVIVTNQEHFFLTETLLTDLAAAPRVSICWNRADAIRHRRLRWLSARCKNPWR